MVTCINAARQKMYYKDKISKSLPKMNTFWKYFTVMTQNVSGHFSDRELRFEWILWVVWQTSVDKIQKWKLTKADLTGLALLFARKIFRCMNIPNKRNHGFYSFLKYCKKNIENWIEKLEYKMRSTPFCAR